MEYFNVLSALFPRIKDLAWYFGESKNIFIMSKPEHIGKENVRIRERYPTLLYFTTSVVTLAFM